MQTATNHRGIEIEPLAGALGAVVHGVDIAAGIDPEQFAEVRTAFHEHGVIFFRDQRLTPPQQLAFARRWGEVDVNRFFRAVDGHPMVAEVRKEPRHEDNIGGGWHTDHSSVSGKIESIS